VPGSPALLAAAGQASAAQGRTGAEAGLASISASSA
jgi:hypothetical protein